MYLSIGSVIIDDIILPDGRSRMGVLGGGGTHAVMGMRAWTDQVRFIAGVGNDFTAAQQAELGEYFDLQGLVRHPGLPTARCWQLFETDGHRSEIFRTGYGDFLQVNPQPVQVPDSLLAVKGVHLQSHSPDPTREWIRRLRLAGSPFILWEPWGTFMNRESWPLAVEILPQVDCFSPNLEESRDLTGQASVEGILEAYLHTGVAMVALRLGASGSLIALRGGGVLRVPPIPVERIVDVTGAGNAYCGGFIVGLGESGLVEEAARCAAVSASLALEQFGALIPLVDLRRRAETRLDACKVEWLKGWSE